MAPGRADLALPEVLAGRFRPLASVGRGAIAEVVRARDETTGEQVALKIIYPHLRESVAVAERFKREVEIVRRVAHPHVLAIRDVVESDGQLFLVMDYHPGGDLADLIARRGRLPPDELRLLAAQLCGALGAAHRAGVVHRDVKPSNVLSGPGPTLDVRLCDFGLARTSELSGLTTANAVLGTPEYMAPEVIADGHADPRSDIYGLGVVLYEAATGKPPFHGDSPYQLMRQHLDVEAPSLADVVPPPIARAIARALAKDPLERFGTAEDFARAMDEEEREPATAARARRRTTRAARRTCRRCGGWLVDAAAACADCGARAPRLERERPGMSVLVTGPGKSGDKLDAWHHVALFKVLDELPLGSVPNHPGGRRAPRVPFRLATELTPPAANALADRLKAVGFEARVERATMLLGPELRKKVWNLTWRYFAGFGVIGNTFSSWTHLLPRGLGHAALMAPSAILLAAPVVLLAVTARRAARPLLGPAARGTPSIGPRARLGRVLPSLESRQDRRLLAHLLERLGQIDALGHAEVAAPLAGHAADAADALAALELRRQQVEAAPRDPRDALVELRREESLRVVVRTHLLRAASRLDDLSLVATRAAAATSADEGAALAREIGELGLAIDAEGELKALLGDAP